MKRVLLVLVAAAFVMVLFAETKSKESQDKPTSCEYTGIIKEKSEKGDREFGLHTEGDYLSFYFKDEGKQECLSWEELLKEQNVTVKCEEKKDRREAVCVKPAGNLNGIRPKEDQAQ